MLIKRDVRFLSIFLILILVFAIVSYAEDVSRISYREDNIENYYATNMKIGVFRVPTGTDRDFILENQNLWENWEVMTNIDRDMDGRDDSGNGGTGCDISTLQKTNDTCLAMVNKYHYCKSEGDYYATLVVEDSKGETTKELSEVCDNSLGILLIVLGVLGVVAGIATGNPEIGSAIGLIVGLVSKFSSDSVEVTDDTGMVVSDVTGDAVYTGMASDSDSGGGFLSGLGGGGGIAASVGGLAAVILGSQDSLQGTVEIFNESSPGASFMIGGFQDLSDLYKLKPNKVDKFLVDNGFNSNGYDGYPAFLFTVNHNTKEMCECAGYTWTGICDKTKNRDYDNDGVLDHDGNGVQVDKCPGTSLGESVDINGCSNKQKLELGDPTDFRFEFNTNKEVSYERPKFEIGLKDGSVLPPDETFDLTIYLSQYIGENGNCKYENEDGNIGTFYCNAQPLENFVPYEGYNWPCSVTGVFSVDEGNHEDFTMTCTYEDGRSDKRSVRYFRGESSALLINYIWKDGSDDMLDVYLNVYGGCKYWYDEEQPSDYEADGGLFFTGICDEGDDGIACGRGYYKHLRTEEPLTQNRIHLMCKDELNEMMGVQTYTFIGIEE